jgi:NAD(P)-dependent dehydrogenase (short-subunit alcohol dehydrogenase family)
VARVLIVGCGCRGAALARSLLDDGHAVRGTTRRPERAAELMAAGIEPWVGDPDRVGSLVYAQDNVTVLCWLLGRVASPALHGPRLRMMLEKTVDTMVRAVAYEPPADPPLRTQGLAVLDDAARRWEIPVAVIDGDPRSAVAALLG